MTRPQAVIFDIGNVLIEWNPERYYDSQLGEAERRRLFAEVDLHGMNEEIDAGGLFRETVYDLADRTPAWAEQIRWWHDRWIDLASPRIDHSLALLRALRRNGVPVFALSNFASLLALIGFPVLFEPYFTLPQLGWASLERSACRRCRCWC